MGRGKVQLKRIEDRNSRQVTFSKRKGGMMKKARELSVLCDVEVAFLIFSDRGRLYKFCSAESIERTLNRYQIHVEEEVAARKRAEQKKKNLAERTDVQTRESPLEIVQRCLENLDIEQKNMTELTQLERELDAILRQARFRKNQLMIETVRALEEEEKELRKEMTGLGEEVEMAATTSENPESSHSRLLEMESNTYSEGDPPPPQQTILRLFNF